jgi:hypothetical protein
VGEEARFDRLPAGQGDAGGGPRPGRRPAVGAGLPEQVDHLGELRRPDVVHAGAEGDVVAEQLGQLEGLPGADGGEQRHPVGLGVLPLVEAELIGEPERDETGPQHVLHRPAEPQVGGEGERGHQLREPHPRRTPRRGARPLADLRHHAPSIAPRRAPCHYG